jgi:hypothetical protein
MAVDIAIEKFTPDELAELRCKLMKAKVDSWQAADMVASFLAGRGYGVNSNQMRSAVAQLAARRGSPERMQAVLETIAFVM